MKSVGLVQFFCPVKETNRTHSKGYVEDLSAQCWQKRCVKMAWLNLSVLPYIKRACCTIFRCNKLFWYFFFVIGGRLGICYISQCSCSGFGVARSISRRIHGAFSCVAAKASASPCS